MAVENIHTVEDVVSHFKGIVTEYWVKKTARRLGIGTRAGRKLAFTDRQLQRFIDAHALEEAKPKAAARAQRTQQPLAAKPKPLPSVNSGVIELRARPERARSYGRTA